MRKKLVILVAVCLIGIFFGSVQVRNHLLTATNYFINIDDAAEVYNIVASEFLIGESTKTDVENAINNRIFGDLRCLSGDTFDSRILCYALASYQIIMPINYLIIWRFEEGKLVEIIVRATVPNAW